MSTPITFQPKYPQPFTLEEAMNLEVDMLAAEITRLENSIEHLQSTQDELLSYLSHSAEYSHQQDPDNDNDDDEDDDDDDEEEIKQVVEENKGVIASQTERISLIRIALLNKLGSDARLEHYGLSSQPLPKPTQTPSADAATTTTTPTTAAASAMTATTTVPSSAPTAFEDEHEDGLHL